MGATTIHSYFVEILGEDKARSLKRIHTIAKEIRVEERESLKRVKGS